MKGLAINNQDSNEGKDKNLMAASVQRASKAGGRLRLPSPLSFHEIRPCRVRCCCGVELS